VNRVCFVKHAICESGGSAIPGAVVGILMGGYCLRQFQLTRRGQRLISCLTCNFVIMPRWHVLVKLFWGHNSLEIEFSVFRAC